MVYRIMATDTQTTDSSKTEASGSSMFLVLGLCILFIIPLAIIYNLFYHKQGGTSAMFLIFIGTYFMGLMVTLIYYRIVVMHQNAQIAKMDSSVVKRIIGLTLPAFMVVAITIFALAINPSLINIFENTIGYSVLGMWGLNNLANTIFSSKTMDEKNKSGDFDYSFLITRFGVNDVSSLNEYFEKGCGSNGMSENPVDYLDFAMKFDDEGQLFDFTNMIYLKHTFGHFTWIYLTSIVSMLISMIAVSL
jgi:hypothetical protein